MKYLIIITVIIFSFLSCSDKKDEQVSNKVEFNVDARSYSGRIVEFYKNGARKYMVNYDNGIKNGKYETWFKSGAKKLEGEYKSGKRIGKWNWYNEEGNAYFAIEYDETQLGSL